MSAEMRDRVAEARADRDLDEMYEVAAAAARQQVKRAVEEWFSDVSLDDLFMVNGWSDTEEPPLTLTVQAGTEPVSALGMVEELDVEIRVAPTSRWYKITNLSGCLPKLYDVVERVRDADGQGKRTDTVTGDLVRAIRRRDEMRRQGRPAYVVDAGGRRIEVSW